MTPAGVWAPIPGTTKNDGDASFTAVSDGSVVPVTDGPPFNLLLVPGGFTFRTVG